MPRLLVRSLYCFVFRCEVLMPRFLVRSLDCFVLQCEVLMPRLVMRSLDCFVYSREVLLTSSCTRFYDFVWILLLASPIHAWLYGLLNSIASVRRQDFIDREMKMAPHTTERWRRIPLGGQYPPPGHGKCGLTGSERGKRGQYSPSENAV